MRNKTNLLTNQRPYIIQLLLPALALMLTVLLPSRTIAQGNVGTEFYVTFPANLSDSPQPTEFVRLYISSNTATEVEVYAAGQFKSRFLTKANNVVTYDLTPLEAQVFVRDESSPVPNDQVYKGKGVHIVANDPITIYAINRTQFTSDGFSILPVNGLGTEYVVATATAYAPSVAVSVPSQFTITAPYDNTNVTIIYSNDTPNHSEGEQVIVTMNSGDVYSAMSSNAQGDLTGTVIRSSNPVAVTAGNVCAYLPNENYLACDHLSEMMLPIESWGTDYYTVPFAQRLKGDTYRIIAGDPNSDIYINGVKYGTINQVGGVLGTGFIEYRQDQRAPLHFSSNGRIAVVQYNHGQQYDNSTSTDPFYTLIPATEQFVDEIIFTTPSDDFPQNYLNVVADSVTMTTIEIAPAGTTNWTTLTNKSGFVRVTFPHDENQDPYAGGSVPLPPGSYHLRSTSGEFGAILYGGGQYDSYGYPLTVSTLDLTIDDFTSPMVTVETECDGSVTGTVRDPGDEIERSNVATVYLDSKSSYNYALEVDPFISRGSSNAAFQLTVENPEISAWAVIVATDGNGNRTIDTVRYSVVDFGLSVQQVLFDSLAQNQMRTEDVEVRNNGAEPLELQSAELGNGTSGFTLSSGSFPVTIPASDSISLSIQFTGAAPGIYRDTIFFDFGCGPPGQMMLYARVIAGGSGSVSQSAGERAGLRMSVSPNPTQGDVLEVRYHLPHRLEADLALFSENGELLRSEQLSGREPGDYVIRLELGDLNSGRYFLRLRTELGDVVREITRMR